MMKRSTVTLIVFAAICLAAVVVSVAIVAV